MAEIVEVVLSGPGKNAMGSELMKSLREQLREAAGAPVLLTGEGDALSAGLNVKEVAGLDAAGMKRFLTLLEDLVVDLFTYPGPTVALVNGHAIAGGCVLTLCCDYRVATSHPKARIGLNEVALGLRFPLKILELCRVRIPKRHLEHVVLGAELFDPETARKLGLVDEVTENAAPVARRHLERLASHPPAAYAAAKLGLRRDLLTPSSEARARWEAEDLPSWTSPELKERLGNLFKR